MKQQSIGTGAAIGAIAVLVIILAFVGWKFLAGGNGSSGAPPPEAAKWMKGSSEGMSQNYRPANSAPPGAMSGSSGNGAH